ncbi:phosphatase, partial [Streptomyces sp. NPDC059515]
MTRSWRITGTADAGAARAAVARAAALCGAPAVERARLAASVGGRLRQCLAKGGTWVLTLDVSASPSGGGTLTVVVAPPPEAAAAGEIPWEAELAVPRPGRAPGPDAPASAGPAQAQR